MDAPSLPPDRLQKALEDLARLNRLFGGREVLTNILEKLIPADETQRISILDIGSGSADIPCHIARWAGRTHRQVRICCLDLNPHSLRVGKAQSWASALPIQFVCADATCLPFKPGQFDFVMASQFLHHFSFPQAVQLLQNFRTMATRGVIISDLQRTRVSFLLTCLGTRLFTRSPVVHHDALVSIRRGFTSQELAELACQGGFDTFEVFTRFPCRLMLVAHVSSTPRRKCKNTSAAEY